MTQHEAECQLISRLISGDPDAFAKIFEKYSKKVYGFALRSFRNKEDAEGATQDVFYQLWKNRSKLKEIKDLEAWIFRVCIFIIRNHFRKLAVEKKYLIHFSDNYLEGDYSTNVDIEYKDLLEKTEKIFEQLPPRQKEIFKLSRNESLSNYQISEKLGISVRTVDNHLTKAKSYIRSVLKEEHLLTILFFFLFID